MALNTDTKPADAPAETKPAAQAPAAPAAAPAPVPEPLAAPAAPAVDAAAIEARIIAENEEKAALCSLAGMPEFLSEAISKRMTVAQVREALLGKQAAKSQATQLRSHVDAAPAGAEAQLNAAAAQLSAARGITFAQAYVEAMKLQPALYQQYLAEKSATVNPT
jgi:pyruvate dehydrogenase E2 component (dihydrolipoamide acetyltransferase)